MTVKIGDRFLSPHRLGKYECVVKRQNDDGTYDCVTVRFVAHNQDIIAGRAGCVKRLTEEQILALEKVVEQVPVMQKSTYPVSEEEVFTHGEEDCNEEGVGQAAGGEEACEEVGRLEEVDRG